MSIDALRASLADRYTIERELGAGGMATVYLARDLKHDRQVAIKVLKPELAAVLGAERFVVEIRTTASLQHPHILPLFDSGVARLSRPERSGPEGHEVEGPQSALYYVMPYIDGETLRHKLDRETQLGVDEAVQIARDVADALDYAHRHGVIHRDIKPENILLHNGRPMVADFGIALAVSAAAGGRMTETGLSLGTPHYMSPEQATAEKTITARSDVYSLGAVLYEMLTGNPPHTGASAQQIIMKIIVEPVVPVATHRRSVPPNVAAAVTKALEKLPADRFESAKAFGDALASPAHMVLGPATPSTLVARGGVWLRLFIATAAVAIAAIAGLVWSLQRREPVHAVTRFSVQLPDSQGLAAASPGSRLAVSPDGRTIVYTGAGASAGQLHLWVRRVDELRATPLAGTDGGFNPAFSPDGKRLAFASAAGLRFALKTVAVDGGVATTLTDSLVDRGGVSWANDGYIYYDGHLSGDGLARIRESGGAPEIVTRADSAAGELYHFHPMALPGARAMLFTIVHAGGPDFYDVGVLDMKTRKYRALVRGLAGYYAAPGYLVYVTSRGTAMAAPFDLKRLVLTGDAVTLFGGINTRALGADDFAISANGLLVYAAGAGMVARRELVWVTRTGAETPVDSQWTGAFVGRFSLSPNGKSLAAAIVPALGAPPEVWIKQLDRGPALKVADSGVVPVWSPDGRTIAYRARAGIMTGPADGSVLPSLFRAVDQVGALQFTHDGKWIVYASRGKLFALRTDGDTIRHPLVADPGIQGNPAVSPDLRWLAYSSDESGRREVYVRPFPDTRPMKRQVSVSGGGVHRWSADGRELFFVDDRFDLISVPITPGPVFATGTPRRLFAGEHFFAPGDFDVDPDGQRFIVSRAVSSGGQRPDELIVVQNFFEELRAKVSVKR